MTQTDINYSLLLTVQVGIIISTFWVNIGELLDPG